MLSLNESDSVFLDSNILIYSYDSADRHKQSLAQEWIAALTLRGSAVLSVQILGEFFSTVTRRIATPLSIEEATEAIERFDVIPTWQIDMPMVRRAISTHSRYGTTYWDSLIIAAAERAGCSAILSEDFNPGQSYHGILAVNPFATSPT